MKAIATGLKFSTDFDGTLEILLALKGSESNYKVWHEELKDLKEMDVEIKKHRNKRSLNANAYLWVILAKMAEVLLTSKDELYLLMLERYGVFTHIIVKVDVADRVREEWRTVRDLGEVNIGKQKGVQLQCYFGSSTYNTKEMATLIDGIISEAKEIGVETLPPKELEIMKEEWKK